MELTSAMPAAAEVPARMAVGIVQEIGKAERTPAVARDSAQRESVVFVGFSALTISPMAPAMALSAKCQRRSPDKSELRLMRFMAIAAQPYGIAVSRPTLSGAVTPVFLMICGSQ